MKMQRCILVCVPVAVVFGGLVASVKADDLYQPPWQRGATNTTYQDWTFNSSLNPVAPDIGVYNPNGTPQATVSGTSTWYQFLDNHAGVWALGSGASIDLFIPNTPRDNTRYKEVWTQVTWEPNGTNAPPVVMVNGIAVTSFTNYATGNANWFQSVYDTRLAYNPSSEDVIITGTYFLGEMVVDTICVPEPSSLALLALGALSLLTYASRKRRLAA